MHEEIEHHVRQEPTARRGPLSRARSVVQYQLSELRHRSEDKRALAMLKRQLNSYREHFQVSGNVQLLPLCSPTLYRSQVTLNTQAWRRLLSKQRGITMLFNSRF